MRLVLAQNQFLDEYILNAQLAKEAGISSNAYLFWRGAIQAKFPRSRTVFLRKDSLPRRYASAIKRCDKLDGLVLASAFCAFTGLASSHLVRSNGSSFYSLVDIREICGIKFVNLKKFYDDFGLGYDLQIYIEKSKFFSPSPLERQIRLTSTLSLGYY